MQIEIIYLSTFGMIFLGQILLKKTTFHPIKFFCEMRDGHSKRERMEINDFYLKRFFTE